VARKCPMYKRWLTCFPGDFIPVAPFRQDTIGRMPFLLASQTANLITQEMKVVPELKKTVTELPDLSRIHLATKGWHIYDPLKTSNSKGSAAIYLARSEDKMNGLLLQYLPPHSRTSAHYHTVQTETYYLLLGKASIETPGATIVLNVPGRSQATIKPGTQSAATHSVITKDLPSLMVIQLVNCPGGLSMDDHHYK